MTTVTTTSSVTASFVHGSSGSLPHGGARNTRMHIKNASLQAAHHCGASVHRRNPLLLPGTITIKEVVCPWRSWPGRHMKGLSLKTDALRNDALLEQKKSSAGSRNYHLFRGRMARTGLDILPRW